MAGRSRSFGERRNASKRRDQNGGGLWPLALHENRRTYQPFLRAFSTHRACLRWAVVSTCLGSAVFACGSQAKEGNESQSPAETTAGSLACWQQRQRCSASKADCGDGRDECSRPSCDQQTCQHERGQQCQSARQPGWPCCAQRRRTLGAKNQRRQPCSWQRRRNAARWRGCSRQQRCAGSFRT